MKYWTEDVFLDEKYRNVKITLILKTLLTQKLVLLEINILLLKFQIGFKNCEIGMISTCDSLIWRYMYTFYHFTTCFIQESLDILPFIVFNCTSFTSMCKTFLELKKTSKCDVNDYLGQSIFTICEYKYIQSKC